MCKFYKLKDTSNLSLANFYLWKKYTQKVRTGGSYSKVKFYWQHQDNRANLNP
jgi:hypothetical protein